MLNKRGVGEGFSWAIGLVAIFVIILFAVIAYMVGHIGEKKPVTIDTSLYRGLSSEYQRVGAYVVSSDFNSSEKGKNLLKIYEFEPSYNTYDIVVKKLDILFPKGYTTWTNIQYETIEYFMGSGFFLSRSGNPNHILFGVTESKDE